MGTWDDGLLDDDAALDTLAELEDGVIEDIERFAAQRPGIKSSAKLAAALGVLWQISPERFSDDESAPELRAAVDRHRDGLARLSLRVGRVSRAIVEGTLARRPARLSARLVKALGRKHSTCIFLAPEAVLFESEAAKDYVQALAKRCASYVDDDFADPDNWRDLRREGVGSSMLGVLLVLPPWRLARAKVERWRQCARKGISQLEAEPDDELEFHRGYYGNLDRVFAALLTRIDRVSDSPEKGSSVRRPGRSLRRS